MNQSASYYFEAGCGRCKHYETPQCKVHRWKHELTILRRMLLECSLIEESKWGMPCYTFNGHNIAMVGAFIDNCTLSFFKGSLLLDALKILSPAGANSQVARLIRFRSVEEVQIHLDTLKRYVFEAVEIEKAGLRVEKKSIEETDWPQELIARFALSEDFKKAFYSLTPGRQRAYIIYISAAVKTETRKSRIDKCIPKIMAGKGLNE